MTYVNQIEKELGVYWINSWQKGLLVRQKEEPISSRGMLNVDSYYSHSFLVIDETVSAAPSLSPIYVSPQYMAPQSDRVDPRSEVKVPIIQYTKEWW